MFPIFISRGEMGVVFTRDGVIVEELEDFIVVQPSLLAGECHVWASRSRAIDSSFSLIVQNESFCFSVKAKSKLVGRNTLVKVVLD